jgi:hypothetical protein
MIGKLYALADRLYQKLTQGDRPVGPDTTKKPWLAALCSIVVCGGGQLYNRQLTKSIWYFLAASVPLALAWGVYLLLSVMVDPEAAPAWLLTATDWARLAAYLVPFPVCLLWLFGVMDAYRTAVLLRAGQLEVRYGVKRQALHLAAGFVPVVGDYVPGATVPGGEQPRVALADLVQQEFRQRLVKRIVTRLVGFGCMFVLLLLLLTGFLVTLVILVTAGGLKMK